MLASQSVLSLADQLQYFKEYIEKLNGFFGEEKTNFILANSLYLVVAGSDDIANTYFVLRARKQYDVPAYTDLMADSASTFIQVIPFFPQILEENLCFGFKQYS